MELLSYSITWAWNMMIRIYQAGGFDVVNIILTGVLSVVAFRYVTGGSFASDVSRFNKKGE